MEGGLQGGVDWDMEWNGMEWNRMEWNRIESNRIGPSELRLKRVNEEVVDDYSNGLTQRNRCALVPLSLVCVCVCAYVVDIRSFVRSFG